MAFKCRKKVSIHIDFMDCFEKFNRTKLPTKELEKVYSILNITNEEYKHARKVWKTFDIKTMGGYHDLYFKSDIILLAIVFENFRKTCLLYYNTMVLVGTLC